MKSFLLGLLLPLGVLFAAGMLVDTEDAWFMREWRSQNWGSLAFLIVGMPLLGAAVGAQLALLLSPRRTFDRRATEGLGRRLLGGFAGGLLTVLHVGVLLILADQYVADTVLVAAAGVLGGAMAILPFGRLRAGVCFHCGYDLSTPPAPGQPGFGRCPECGADCMASAGEKRSRRSHAAATAAPSEGREVSAESSCDVAAG